MSGSSELPFEITLDDMIDEVERELNMRRDVYGRRVRENGMNRRRADRQIDVMAAIRDKLKGERDARKGDRDC
jgi:hypothetical protein